jgi:DNA (cytosine-5)-methyltransferase 1
MTAAAVEIDQHAVATLRLNRPQWNVIHRDVREINGRDFRGVDLFAGGVPCPPFSKAGKQLGAEDERDLFPEALRLISECKPRAVLLENVPGFAERKFDEYRNDLLAKLEHLGFIPTWRVIQASDLGVPQLRPRFILTALRPEDSLRFSLVVRKRRQRTVGQSLLDLMGVNGWRGAAAWSESANRVAPTLVGGSKKHGGPDLGPTRAKRQWEQLHVDGMGLADDAPGADLPDEHRPRLTVRMTARLQGFPDAWQFSGRKTNAYRQVGNAFPPPVAAHVGRAILRAFQAA